MSLSCGIVGLPNVGKSTLFSALTKSMVESQNYPFTTIEPNIGIVDVPDERLYHIAKIVMPQRILHSTVRFVDVAGLVKGASEGEGLGNKFLSHIREVNAIIQVVRIFENDDIIHVNGTINPINDFDIIMTELILKDIDTLTKQKEKTIKNSKANKALQEELPFLEECLQKLNEGIMLSTFIDKDKELPTFLIDTKPLTLKPMLVAANMDEQHISDPESSPLFLEMKNFLAKKNIEIIPFCAKLELEIVSLPEEEKQEMLNLYSIKESGLSQIIRYGYGLLNYISYFTAGEQEVRSWTIEKGWKAPIAAGVIHSDFEKGFIRAEVMHYNDFMQYQGEKGVKENGKLQSEGKDYIVQDGDIILFRFNR